MDFLLPAQYTKQDQDQTVLLPCYARAPLPSFLLTGRFGQVKLLEGRGLGSLLLRDFLSQAVEAPPLPSITNAVQLLEEIGALTPKTEKLTLLGSHLASLPLPPRVSKMLLYGILFHVLDPLLTVACCIAYRSASEVDVSLVS